MHCPRVNSGGYPEPGLCECGRSSLRQDPRLPHSILIARIGAYAIPDGVTRIGAYAFAGSAGVTDITLPDGVVAIGDQAFASSHLNKVNIPPGVTTIGDLAFHQCWALLALEIPASVTTMGTRHLPVSAASSLSKWTTSTLHTKARVASCSTETRRHSSPVPPQRAGRTRFQRGSLASRTRRSPTVGAHQRRVICEPHDHRRQRVPWRRIGIDHHSRRRSHLGNSRVQQLRQAEPCCHCQQRDAHRKRSLFKLSAPQSIRDPQRHHRHRRRNVRENRSDEHDNSRQCGPHRKSVVLRMPGLASLSIPSGVRSIGERAFEGAGLTRITIPGGVVSISDLAFYGCRPGTCGYPEGSRADRRGRASWCAVP